MNAEHRAEHEGLDLDRLRALAEAATPGPWTADVLGSEGYAVHGGERLMGRAITRRLRLARCGHEDWDTDRANAEYIAATDPATLLTLLDRLDRAERAHSPGPESGS